MGIVEQTVDKMKAKLDDACEMGTISGPERILSVIAGGFILGYSVKRLFKRPLAAISGVTVGTTLIARGVAGKCPVVGAMENAEEGEEERNLTLIERRYFEK